MGLKKTFYRHDKIIGILVLVIFAALFWYSTMLRGAFFSIINIFTEFSDKNPALAIVIFVLAAALSAMFSFFSSIPLVPIAVAIFGANVTFLMLLSGWVLGGTAAYMVGKYAGYPFLKNLAPIKAIERQRVAISAESEFFIVLLFRLAMPAEIPGYMLGAIKYHFWKFLLATFISEAPFALITSYGSAAILTQRTSLFYIWSFFGCALLISITYVFRDKLRIFIEK